MKLRTTEKYQFFFVQFSVDQAMVCQRGGFIIQRHNELRDLEAEVLRMVCNDVEVEPVLQEVTGEILNHGANKVPNACLGLSNTHK